MIGQLLAGHYQLVKILGAGGFGKTYIAEDSHLPGNPKCVVKHLSPASNDPYVLDTARRLFQKEAETLQKLGNYDQIPRLLAYFEENHEFYLVQELINGHTLGEELPRGQKWNENQVTQMLVEALEILGFVHSQGVIHRDIKPDNIIRRAADNKLVLIDFGAIKQVRNQSVIAGSQASISVAIGTPGYMPTEQSRGTPRPSSDIYALGMIGIQALTGVYPHELQEDAQTGEIMWQHLVSASARLVAILEKMTRYHFKDRYQTTDEALVALNVVKPAKNPKPQLVAKTLPVQPIKPEPDTIKVAPNSLPSPLPANPVSASSKKLPILIGSACVAIVSLTGVSILLHNPFYTSSNSDRTSKVNPISPESCFAVVNGNIRSTPTSSQDNKILSASGDKLEITGQQTQGGWIGVKLANGNSGWAHRDVISNGSEMDTCIQKNQISIQTVNDIPRSEPTSSKSKQPNETSTETAQSEADKMLVEKEQNFCNSSDNQHGYQCSGNAVSIRSNCSELTTSISNGENIHKAGNFYYSVCPNPIEAAQSTSEPESTPESESTPEPESTSQP